MPTNVMIVKILWASLRSKVSFLRNTTWKKFQRQIETKSLKKKGLKGENV